MRVVGSSAARGKGVGASALKQQNLSFVPNSCWDRGWWAKCGNRACSRRHKKRGKSGRYLVRDWAICGGRGQSFVGPTSWGDDLSKLWTELDTGLCCDYFKARDSGPRGCGYLR